MGVETRRRGIYSRRRDLAGKQQQHATRCGRPGFQLRQQPESLQYPSLLESRMGFGATTRKALRGLEQPRVLQRPIGDLPHGARESSRGTISLVSLFHICQNRCNDL